MSAVVKRMMPAVLGAVVIFAVGVDADVAVSMEQNLGSNPLAGNSQAISAGKSMFRKNCSYCHGVRANGRGRGLPKSADLRKFKRGYLKFVQTVKNGRKTMPHYPYS